MEESWDVDAQSGPEGGRVVGNGLRDAESIGFQGAVFALGIGKTGVLVAGAGDPGFRGIESSNGGRPPDAVVRFGPNFVSGGGDEERRETQHRSEERRVGKER